MTKRSLRLQVIERLRTNSRLELITKQIESPPNEPPDSNVKVILEGVWLQNQIGPDNIIHLLNPFHDLETNSLIVNNSQGLLVVEPDSLLTCTAVASSLFCERKTWLNNVFLGQVGTNRAMLVGTLVHEVFQYGVKNRIADRDKLIQFLDNLLDDATVMLEIYSVELHIDDIRTEAVSYVSSIKEWIEKFMFAGPSYPLTNDNDLQVKVTKICDIEENVWSTKYGLKGKIDVTGLVRVHDKKLNKSLDQIIPLELKTGNPNLSASHAAQVSLYSMMIEDRYAETNTGLVIYLKDKAAMHAVQLKHNIKRDLVQRRNQVNYHMKNYMIGPDVLDQMRVCQNCERFTECILMSNIYEPGKLKEYHPTTWSHASEAVGHLDSKFISFFQSHHERLVRLMTTNSFQLGSDLSESTKVAGSFWTYSSERAEQCGLGFAKLQASVSKDMKIVTFKRHPDHLLPADQQKEQKDEQCNSQANKRRKIGDYFEPITNGDNFSKGRAKPFDTSVDFSRCRMAISLDSDKQCLDTQNSSTAVAIGFINELKEDYFTLKLYEGTLDIVEGSCNPVFRVDKLEKRSQPDMERVVLVRLLDKESWRAERVRQLIIEPDFEIKRNAEMNLSVLSANFEEISQLEEREQRFVVEAVSTDNFCILDERALKKKDRIDGLVSALTSVIVNVDRSVLIVAQNVDQLVPLMRILNNRKVKFILIDDGKSTKARFLFPGNLVKVVQLETMNLKMKFNAYIRRLETSPVVITSYAMSIGGLLFSRRTFDYCVAYDCDSTELLLSLSPMFSSDRYIILDVQGEDDDQAQKDKESLGNHLRKLRKQSCDK